MTPRSRWRAAIRTARAREFTDATRDRLIRFAVIIGCVSIFFCAVFGAGTFYAVHASRHANDQANRAAAAGVASTQHDQLASAESAYGTCIIRNAVGVVVQSLLQLNPGLKGADELLHVLDAAVTAAGDPSADAPTTDCQTYLDRANALRRQGVR